MKSSKFLSILQSFAAAWALLTAAIAVPILCRPFYYAHIGPLELEARTGLTEAQIKTAYNEVLDYCLGAEEFSTGVLTWSEGGKSHFTDVRGLFLLDLWTLGASSVVLVGLLIYSKAAKCVPALILGRGPAFWAGAGLGGVCLVAGGLVSLDFDRGFILFHRIFFPGKDNWMFDPGIDQIINILPQVFFRNCAFLIAAILVMGCGAMIVWDLARKKR